MPRAEVGSIKWLSNKMKAKGLQRLRWYCQMCEKQCRDENGFKCHMISESHARQMQVFSQRPGRFMDEFSRSFEADFMRFMRTKYCRTRVLANTVYCELISNKTHIHMNATVWVTLSEFVRYLGRSGKCNVEETPRGFYLTYLDPDKIARDNLAANNLKAEAAAEILAEQRLKKAVLAAQKQAAASTKRIPTGQLDQNSTKVNVRTTNKILSSAQINLGIKNPPPTSKRTAANLFGNEEEEIDLAAKMTKRPNTMLDKLIPQQQLTGISNTQASPLPESSPVPLHPLEDSDEWVSEDLIVKWKGNKGLVVSNLNGLVRLRLYPLNQNLTAETQDSNLDTVIPKSTGKWVRIVLGTYRGHEGRILSLDTDNERVSVMIFYGPYWGDPAADWPNPPKPQNALLERGELRADDLPMDAVCRAGPPVDFQDLDQPFQQQETL